MERISYTDAARGKLSGLLTHWKHGVAGMLTAGFRARTGMWCRREENPHVTMCWASYAAPCGRSDEVHRDYDIGTMELKKGMRRVRPGKILRDGKCCMALARAQEDATRAIGSMMTTASRKVSRLRARKGRKE